MPSDTKNRNNQDEDTKSEPDILSQRFAHVDEELESDASTFAFDDSYPDGRSADILRSDLQSRDERIGQLQFDAEQLRMRWTGLEKEIKAREELTEILQRDLKDANNDRAAQAEHINNQQHQIDLLAAEFNTVRESLAELSALQRDSANLNNGTAPDSTPADEIQIEGHASSPSPHENGLVELQLQLEQERLVVSELKTYIDGRKNDWDALRKEVKTGQSTIVERDERLKILEQTVVEKQHALNGAVEKVARLNQRLVKEQSNTKLLRKKNHALARDIESYQTDLNFKVENRLAVQSGQLVSNSDEIATLKGQVARSELYADELRQSLSNLGDAFRENEIRREQFDAALEQANEQVGDLREQLDAERALTADLSASNHDLKSDFEEEVRKIRFELGAAQETIGDVEATNEQLNSSLIDNNHFRTALEEQLSAVEEAHALENGKLENQLLKLRRQILENERKIINKDNAITALLNELADKSRTIDSMDNVGDVISEIDVRMWDRIEEQSGSDRERPARLLIGTIDGQELQYPLFKERLTIGRTSQNDIQLKAQYVSRRHAVILSDEDGPRIVDWGSKNGIAVNDEKVTEQYLRNGDKVTIGISEFIFEERQKR